jgi:bla regulator protein BlaR1
VSDWEYIWSSGWSFVINHLWQSTVFAAIAWCAVLALRNAPARLRYWIWVIASVKFIVPSALIVYLANAIGFSASSLLLSIAWSTGDPVSLVGRQHRMFHLVGSSNPFFTDLSVWFGALGILWILGAAIFFVIWFRRHRGMMRELYRGIRVTRGTDFELLQQLKQQMGIRRPVELMESESFAQPGVCGVWRPVIVFPVSMAATLGRAELEAVMVHELAHIARWDNLISNAQMVVNSLLWFHPLVWWIDRRMLAERERACDDHVLASCKASKVYASGLLKVVRFGVQLRVAGISCVSGSDLKTRIQHIVSGRSAPRFSLAHKLVVTALIGLMLTVSVAAVDIGDCERDLLQKRITTKSSCPSKQAQHDAKTCAKKLLRS